MAEIVDARSSGGAILVLGDALALPISSAAATSPKPLGSVRFNPDLQEIELYRLISSSSYNWKTLDRYVLDTSGFYPVSGGPVSGGITLTNNGHFYSTYGTPLEPGICFSENMNTGISGTNLGHLQFSTKGSLTFKANDSLIEFPTSLRATAATITTVTTNTLNADSINTFIPREVSFSYMGTFTPLKVVHRYIVARRLVVSKDWVGSIATLGTPASVQANFQIRRIRSNLPEALGTITFGPNSRFGTFTSSGNFTLHGGDRLEIIAPPIADDDMADLNVTLAATSPMQADATPTNISFTASGILSGGFWQQGGVLGTLTATDPDGANFNYALLDSANRQFQVVANQIQIGSAPLRGGQFTVQVTDDDGLSYTKNFSVTVPPRSITGTSLSGSFISGAFSVALVSASVTGVISPFTASGSGSVSIVGAASDSIGLSISTGVADEIVKLSSLASNSTFFLGLYDHSSVIEEFAQTIVTDALASLSANSVVEGFAASGIGFASVTANTVSPLIPILSSSTGTVQIEADGISTVDTLASDGLSSSIYSGADVPALTAWPDATNTGVPVGTTLTDHIGDLTTTSDGQVIDSLNITGLLQISHNDVTVQRCKVTNGGDWVIVQDIAITGTNIFDCELDGMSAAGTGIRMGNGTVKRCNIHGSNDGVVLKRDNVLIQDNYIWGLAGEHMDGIQNDGECSHLVIRHNTIHNPNNETSCVMLDTFFGPLTDVIIDNNQLIGAGYNIYCTESDASGFAITDITITNNVMTQGANGFYDFYNFSGYTPTRTGNVSSRGVWIDGDVPTVGSQIFAPSAGLAGHDRNDNTAFRMVATLGAPAASQMRFVFKAGAGDLVIDKAFYGKGSVNSNATAALTAVTFGGSTASLLLATDSYAVSDWMTLSEAYNASDTVVVGMSLVGSGNGFTGYSGGNTNITSYYNPSIGTTVGDASPSGYSLSAGNDFGLYRIETR